MLPASILGKIHIFRDKVVLLLHFFNTNTSTASRSARNHTTRTAASSHRLLLQSSSQAAQGFHLWLFSAAPPPVRTVSSFISSPSVHEMYKEGRRSRGFLLLVILSSEAFRFSVAGDGKHANLAKIFIHHFLPSSITRSSLLVIHISREHPSLSSYLSIICLSFEGHEKCLTNITSHHLRQSVQRPGRASLPPRHPQRIRWGREVWEPCSSFYFLSFLLRMLYSRLTPLHSRN